MKRKNPEPMGKQMRTQSSTWKGRPDRRRMAAALLAAVLGSVPILGGCGSRGAQNPGISKEDQNYVTAKVSGKNADREAEKPAPVSLKADDYKGWNQLLEDNQISESFQEGLGRFAFESGSKVLSASAEQERNVCYSPLSLYYALALAGCGAEEETEAEILEGLGAADRGELSEQCRKLYQWYFYYQQQEAGRYAEYENKEFESQVKLANSIWISKSLEVKEEYRKLAARQFFAPSYLVDFQEPEAGKRIGGWISEQTNGVLEPQLSIPKDTLMSIVNTLYFYGSWQSPFQAAKTKEDVFYREDGSENSCLFMNAVDEMGQFRKGDGYTVSYLGTNNQCRMVFLLPDEGRSVGEFFKTPEEFQKVMDVNLENPEWSKGKVTWKVPKFRFGSSFQLPELLKSMGMEQMFREDADFGGISDSPLWISDVIQETHIGVDEQGVEGAAYTMMLAAGSAMVRPEQEARMILDRPFLFGIQDRANGVWLFLGAVRNPEQD